jgi:phage shock protein A
MGELEAAGTFDDLTQLGTGKDDIDRQLESLTTSGAVDDELSKMRAELGGGGAAQQLGQGAGEHAGPAKAAEEKPAS